MRNLVVIVTAAKLLVLIGSVAFGLGLLLTLGGLAAGWAAWSGLLLAIAALSVFLLCSRVLLTRLQRTENAGMTTVYMPLLNEGVDVWRPVEAMKITNLRYMVTEPAPAGEEWAFQAGYILRCEERQFDGETRLVIVDKETNFPLSSDS